MRYVRALGAVLVLGSLTLLVQHEATHRDVTVRVDAAVAASRRAEPSRAHGVGTRSSTPPALADRVAPTAATRATPTPLATTPLPARDMMPSHDAVQPPFGDDVVVVGLNRQIYQEGHRRAYTCKDGLRCVFTSERSDFRSAFAIIDVLKDPRKVAPLDFQRRPGQLVGVVISEKDAAKKGNGRYAANAYDFEVGYNEKTACMWKPFVCNEVEKWTNRTLLDELAGLPPRRAAALAALPSKKSAVVAFVSNCGGVPWRRDYLQELMQHIEVHSYGTCLRNRELPDCPFTKEQIRKLSRSHPCSKRGTNNVIKMRTIEQYKWLFSFENLVESHYVTEKPYDGLRMGVLPIYKGAPEVAEHVPPGALLFADRFSSARQLAEYLHYLDRNDSAYLEYFDWEPAAAGRMPVGQRCPWQCRVCELQRDLALQQQCQAMAQQAAS